MARFQLLATLAVAVAVFCLMAAKLTSSASDAPTRTVLLLAAAQIANPEMKLITDSLQRKRPLTTYQTFCLEAYVGEYAGLQIVAVYTGQGATPTALCVNQVFNSLPSFEASAPVEQILWVGTSGWGPYQGGWQWPQSDPSKKRCDKLPAAKTKRLSIGSVCITSAAVNFNCRACTSNVTKVRNECGDDGCTNVLVPLLFGNCSYKVDADMARIVYESARTARLPKMADHPGTLQFTEKWWKENQMDDAPADQPPPTVPSILGPHECLEMDGRSFLTSAYKELSCRNLSAWQLGGGRTAADTPCLEAFEGVGLLELYQKWAGPLKQLPPLAIIRGASNYLYNPVRPLGVRGPDGEERWEQVGDVGDYFAPNFEYSSKITNTIALHYLEQVAAKAVRAPKRVGSDEL